MPKLYLIILILIVLIATSSVIFVIKKPEKTAQTVTPTPSQPISIEEINDLISQASNYEAKLEITSSSGEVYNGYTYVAPTKAKIIYESKGKVFVSNIDLSKKEIVNYNLKNKKGVKIPSQTKEKETIFKQLPTGAKIIKQSEIINGIDCVVVQIKQENKTETLWISKNDGIIIKSEVVTPQETTIYQLSEIKNIEVTEKKLEIPAEIKIVDSTSEEFVSLVQKDADTSSLLSLPSLPLISVEPSISSQPENLEETQTPAPSSPKEGIYEETSPYLPPDFLPVY